jgi:hypothetical protein
MKIEGQNITTSSWHSASCDKFLGMFDFNYLSALDIPSVLSTKNEAAPEIPPLHTDWSANSLHEFVDSNRSAPLP